MPVLALSQLSRAVEQREDKRPAARRPARIGRHRAGCRRRHVHLSRGILPRPQEPNRCARPTRTRDKFSSSDRATGKPSLATSSTVVAEVIVGKHRTARPAPSAALRRRTYTKFGNLDTPSRRIRPLLNVPLAVHAAGSRDDHRSRAVAANYWHAPRDRRRADVRRCRQGRRLRAGRGGIVAPGVSRGRVRDTFFVATPPRRGHALRAPGAGRPKRPSFVFLTASPTGAKRGRASYRLPADPGPRTPEQISAVGAGGARAQGSAGWARVHARYRHEPAWPSAHPRPRSLAGEPDRLARRTSIARRDEPPRLRRQPDASSQ